MTQTTTHFNIEVNGLPAIITHHLFGEDASSLFPEGILTGQEDLIAFLLGNQGSDPFWARFSTAPGVTRACHQFASRMHSEKVGEALIGLRNCVNHLREDDKNIGRAFALGVAAHYVLDSVAHPLVYAQQEGIVAADPSLKDARPEIHAIIEADLDSWLLWEKRNLVIPETPCTQALARTSHIDQVAGAMLSQVAWEVFGISIGATEYGLAVRDYQLFYRLIDSPQKPITRVITRLERVRRRHSWLLAHTHRTITDGECPFANLDHRRWKNPATGETSTASIPDLFHDALTAWPEFSKRLAEGDLTRLDAMIAGIDYNGRPITR